MGPLGRRHLTTAVTMLVLVGILVLGVVIGVDRLFAPVPGSEEPVAEPEPTCTTQTVRKGQRIRSSQVQVSVFNGGTRSGLADETLNVLTRRGFKPGDAGNAPAGTKVAKVQIWTTEKNDSSARLVARQFGKATKVRVVDQDLGPGVDVIVGNKFSKLAKAPRALTVRKPSSVCVPPVVVSPVS